MPFDSKHFSAESSRVDARVACNQFAFRIDLSTGACAQGYWKLYDLSFGSGDVVKYEVESTQIYVDYINFVRQNVSDKN